jgi:hypothetical protein
MAALHQLLPTVAVGFPDGAAEERSTYLHLLVCSLEHQALIQLFGELKAKQVMEFWATDHYRWVYRTVLERSQDIGRIIEIHGLLPSR